MECPQLPDWETEAGTVQRQSTGPGSSDLGLLKLGLFSFLRGEEVASPPKPLGMVLLHPQRLRTCSGCSVLGCSRPPASLET